MSFYTVGVVVLFFVRHVFGYTFRMCLILFSVCGCLYFQNVFRYAVRICLVIRSECLWLYFKHVFGSTFRMFWVLLAGQHTTEQNVLRLKLLPLSIMSQKDHTDTHTHTQNLINHMLDVLDWTTEGSTTLGTKL